MEGLDGLDRECEERLLRQKEIDRRRKEEEEQMEAIRKREEEEIKQSMHRVDDVMVSLNRMKQKAIQRERALSALKEMIKTKDEQMLSMQEEWESFIHQRHLESMESHQRKYSLRAVEQQWMSVHINTMKTINKIKDAINERERRQKMEIEMKRILTRKKEEEQIQSKVNADKDEQIKALKDRLKAVDSKKEEIQRLKGIIRTKDEKMLLMQKENESLQQQIVDAATDFDEEIKKKQKETEDLKKQIENKREAAKKRITRIEGMLNEPLMRRLLSQ